MQNNFENVSVIDILDAIKSKLNDKGIKRYSNSKADKINETINEYLDSSDAPSKLRKIIGEDLPAAIQSCNSLSVDKWIDALNNTSQFLSLTIKSITNEIKDEFKSYNEQNRSQIESALDDFDSCFEEYWGDYRDVHADCPDITEEDYDEIADAWDEGDIDESVLKLDNYYISPELEAQIQDVINNKNKFSSVRSYLFNKKLNWYNVDGYDKSSLFGTVIQASDEEFPTIYGDSFFSNYFDTTYLQENVIFKCMKDYVC